MISNLKPSFFVSKDSNSISLYNAVSHIEKDDNLALDKEGGYLDLESERIGSLSWDESKPVFFDDTLSIFYSGTPDNSYYRNHFIEELKLSVRVAKKNLSFDKENKYYQDQLNKAQSKLELEISKTKLH